MVHHISQGHEGIKFQIICFWKIYRPFKKKKNHRMGGRLTAHGDREGYHKIYFNHIQGSLIKGGRKEIGEIHNKPHDHRMIMFAFYLLEIFWVPKFHSYKAKHTKPETALERLPNLTNLTLHFSEQDYLFYTKSFEIDSTPTSLCVCLSS